MTDNPYRDQMKAAHERLTGLLAAKTDQEVVITEWLGLFDLPTLQTLIILIERQQAQRYSSGYRDGIKYARERQLAGVDPELWIKS